MTTGTDSPVLASKAAVDDVPGTDYVPGTAGRRGSGSRNRRPRGPENHQGPGPARWALVRFVVDSACSPSASGRRDGLARGGLRADAGCLVPRLPGPHVVLLYARGAYQPRLHPRLLDELRRVIGASAIAAMAATTARVVLTDDPIPSTQAVRPWLFATACLVAARVSPRLGRHAGPPVAARPRARR